MSPTSREGTPAGLNAGLNGAARPIRPPVVQPQAANRRGGGPQSIIVNGCQRGNPILDNIRHVAWEYGQIVPDYQVGSTTCVLFLSLRYHRLHPEYLHQRIQKLGSMYVLRILLLMCDITEHQESIRELTKICLINNMTVMVAWTPEEAGQYLATYKMFEHKPPDRIKERVDKDYPSMLRSALTSIRGVNKTDVTTLSTTVGSLADIAEASSEQLLNCPGFGEVKARRVQEAFQKPFRNNLFAEKGSQRAPSSMQRPSQATTASGPTQQNSRSNPTPAQRPPSPPWDIDLDLNGSDTASQPGRTRSPSMPPPQKKSRPNPPTNGVNGAAKAPLGSAAASAVPGARPPREPSPVWDLELDLNPSDIE